MTTPQMFRKVLRDMGCPDEKPLGAYIPQSIEYPLRKNIILIGDAGGFANKLTGEGLYDAFKTAANAKRAIVEGRSFSETNKEEFRKMEHQKKVYEFFFSPIGWRLLRWALRCPRIIKWLFDAKMKRETFRA